MVEQSNIKDLSAVREGDVLVGLPSNGLHTNGYSLVRHVLDLDDDPTPWASFTRSLAGRLARRCWRRTAPTTESWRLSSRS